MYPIFNRAVTFDTPICEDWTGWQTAIYLSAQDLFTQGTDYCHAEISTDPLYALIEPMYDEAVKTIPSTQLPIAYPKVQIILTIDSGKFKWGCKFLGHKDIERESEPVELTKQTFTYKVMISNPAKDGEDKFIQTIIDNFKLQTKDCPEPVDYAKVEKELEKSYDDLMGRVSKDAEELKEEAGIDVTFVANFASWLYPLLAVTLTITGGVPKVACDYYDCRFPFAN